MLLFKCHPREKTCVYKYNSILNKNSPLMYAWEFGCRRLREGQGNLKKRVVPALFYLILNKKTVKNLRAGE